jgi:DNA-binding response OmpR family regulator
MSEKKILVVDDDLYLVLGMIPRLRACGYAVISAPDAVSALWLAHKESPDLIILDLGLPAADGFEVLEQMREQPGISSIPVIVLSAREPLGNKQCALDRNAAAYFQKPPDGKQFLNAIRHALGEPTVQTTLAAN